jgi:multidrug efflux pump subunit AcrA (membrane-fusion protein)
LTDDHKQSIAHFQEQSDQARELTETNHQNVVRELRTRIDSTTADFTGKLNAAESRIQELRATHQENIAALTTERDALISAAEASKASREKELQDEISALVEAMQITNNKIMVVSLNTELKEGNARSRRRR